MFQCDRCKCLTKPGERLQLRVSKVRMVHYMRPGGTSDGVESVKEQKLCTDCSKVLADTPPEVVGNKYIEFPKNEKEAQELKEQPPTGVTVARLPRNWSRIKKRLQRERMRTRREEVA